MTHVRQANGGALSLTSLVLLVVGVVVGVCSIPAACAEVSTDEGWQMGPPIVTYWAGPMPMTDAVAKQMSEGGWNLVWVTRRGVPKGVNVVDHFLAQLNVLQRHGLRGILSLGYVPRKFEEFKALDDPNTKAELDTIVDAVREHPALYAYSLKDEPSVSLFPNLRRMKDYLREKDPSRLVYVNLFPIYANNKQLGTDGEPVPAYREYLRQFVETVRPQLLSYDHYHFAVKGDGDNYFLNLAEMRQAALDADIPFMAILQACSWTVNMRIPTGDELRWLAYTSLAYGSQGISWYVYGYPGHDGGMIVPAGTYREPHIARAMGRAVLGGSPTPLYYCARELHKEFVAVASELRPLKSLAVYHVGMLPDGTLPLPDNAMFRIDPSLPHKEYATPVEGFVIGYFGKGQSPSHVLVVNLDYRTYGGIGQPRREEFLNPARRAVVGPRPLEVFDAKTSKWFATDSNRVELRLPPGGGLLVRVTR